jgi:hypothetical protein
VRRPESRWRNAGAVLAAAAMVAALGAAPRAAAADVGQIAVIEDTTGKILPASGMCGNLMYPHALCVPQAGQAFYATHPDAYDYLVFLTNKAVAISEKAGYPLKAGVAGIGQDSTPWSYTHFGSAGRLQHAVDLGSVQSLPDDPEGIFTGSVPYSGLEVLGHELGHRYMSYASIDLGDGFGSRDIIRGYLNSSATVHWSCWLSSDSVMYGGMFTDHGNGTFTDVNGPRKYSQLDQYLMGLRTTAEVDPMYYVVVNGSITGCPDPPLARGVAHDVTGVRTDFSIDDVIRALGARSPATSPCHLKVGFVFAHAAGNPPSPGDLAKVELYRTAIETWYAQATDQRASLDTSLDGCGIGTAGCPGAPSPQCTNPPDGGIYDAGQSDGPTDGHGPSGDASSPPQSDSAAAADGSDGGGGGGGGCGCRAARAGAAPMLACLLLGALIRAARRRGR